MDPVQQHKQKLFVVHPDGTGLHQINLDISGGYFASEPTWSPDGTKIVLRLFLASTGRQYLYTVRPTGSDLRPLAGTQGSEEFPDWGSQPLANTQA
jgi:Tol biopolymer transport system component